MKFHRQQDRVEIALMVGDDQHPAAPRDVIRVVDLQIERAVHPHAAHDPPDAVDQGLPLGPPLDFVAAAAAAGHCVAGHYVTRWAD